MIKVGDCFRGIEHPNVFLLVIGKSWSDSRTMIVKKPSFSGDICPISYDIKGPYALGRYYIPITTEEFLYVYKEVLELQIQGVEAAIS